MRNIVAGVVGLATLLVAKSAWAAFHIMQITEVFPGTTAQPNAQYIELQMYAANQNIVGGHTVTVFDAAGTMVMTYTFAANVASGTNQSTILIATSQAQALFGVTPDLVMTATIPAAGGKVCFENIDCVAWGNYTGPATPSPVGQPAYQARGLVLGRSLTRKLGAGNMLDAADDTNVSATDFERALPTPRNNAGTAPTIPTATCGDGATTGLESCDDNNTTANDGCSAMCVTENCGDGIVQTTETCDDTNTNNTDACSNTCGTQTPMVDGPPNPTSDDQPLPPGDDGGGCCQTGGAGATPLLALLVLGMLLRRRVS
jgi:uncharacterized protein (TIGR03382 family)